MNHLQRDRNDDDTFDWISRHTGLGRIHVARLRVADRLLPKPGAFRVAVLANAVLTIAFFVSFQV